jgi:hypothetical protein
MLITLRGSNFVGDFEFSPQFYFLFIYLFIF